jgi:parallel beta-helix repeat protein
MKLLYKLPLAALMVTCASAYGSTLVVNNNLANTGSPCSTAAYSTIGAALIAANPGDTVDVCPGTYSETVYINKAGIKLIGLTTSNSSLIELMPGAGIPVNDPDPSAENPVESSILFVDGVSGVQIYNISVNGYLATTTCGSGNAGIYFRNASGTITDSAVGYIGLNSDGTVTGCQEGLGIYIQAFEATANVKITGTSVHDYDKNGITLIGSGLTFVANTNEVTGVGPTTATAQNGIEVYLAKGTINSNVVQGDDYEGPIYGASGILIFNAANGTEANDNVVSDTNLGIYFYQSNHGTANGNNVSKTVSYNALTAFQSSQDVFEHNVVTRAGLEQDQAAVYLCGSNNTVSNNTINEAPVGIQDDRTSVDGCTGAAGNLKKADVYTNVGTDLEVLTDGPTPETVGSPKAAGQQLRPKLSPVK